MKGRKRLCVVTLRWWRHPRIRRHPPARESSPCCRRSRRLSDEYKETSSDGSRRGGVPRREGDGEDHSELQSGQSLSDRGKEERLCLRAVKRYWQLGRASLCCRSGRVAGLELLLCVWKSRKSWKRRESDCTVLCCAQGDLGPFNPGLPVDVPVWLALNLKQRQKCRIVPPAWMDVGQTVALCYIL